MENDEAKHIKTKEINLASIVRRIIDGDITIVKAAKEAGVSTVTLNELISAVLPNTEPNLYAEFIEKNPYKPRKIENINFVNFMKKIMHEKLEIIEYAGRLGIDRRTSARRIKEYKDSELIDEETGLTYGQIYELYTLYRLNKLNPQQKKLIENFTVGEVQTGNNNDIQEMKLKQSISKYQELLKSGVDWKEAAAIAGYKSPNSIRAAKRELSRIENERAFKSGLRVEGITGKVEAHSATNTETRDEEKGIEPSEE